MANTQEQKLRAMADGYPKDHLWDHLDAETCRKAADEIQRLRSEIDQQNDVIRLYAEKQFTVAPTPAQIEALIAPYVEPDEQSAYCINHADMRAFAKDLLTTAAQPKRSQPLTDQQIRAIHFEWLTSTGGADTLRGFARAIEAAHGIKHDGDTGGAQV